MKATYKSLVAEAVQILADALADHDGSPSDRDPQTLGQLYALFDGPKFREANDEDPMQDAAIEMQASHSAAAYAVPVHLYRCIGRDTEWTTCSEEARAKLEPNEPKWYEFKVLYDHPSPTTAPAATTPAASERVDMLPLTDWQEFKRISDLPDVDESLRGFSDDPTADNAICVVRSVINAHTAAKVAANKPAERPACDPTATQCPRCQNKISDCDKAFAGKPAAASGEAIPVWELYRDGWDAVEGLDSDWMTTLPFGTKLYYLPNPAPQHKVQAGGDAAGMPVSQEPKYGIRENRLYNRASGEFIPVDEPVFIFRARDMLAVAALNHYADMCADRDHREAVSRRVLQFHNFSVRHSTRMKLPDTAALPESAAKPVDLTLDPAKWVILHNGQSIVADSVTKLMLAARDLRTEDEKLAAAEKLLKAMDEELAELRTPEYILKLANELIEDAKSAGFVVQIGKKYLAPYAMGNYIMEATVYPDHASHRKVAS